MTIKICDKGHFYDGDEFSDCPVCRDVTADIPERFRQLGDPSLLGEGSTGRVYRIRGEKDFALKAVECAGDEVKYKNALHEREIMERLSGCGEAVQLCGFEITRGSGGQTVWFLEEYGDLSLADRMTSAPMKASEALAIAGSLCRALAGCAARGVLHLDVQPKNVFLQGAEVKLGDFGSSLTAEEAAANDRMRGTLAYMAPEVYREGTCSLRSDLYSVGVILYALFRGGQLPFEGDFIRETAAYKRLAGTPLPSVEFPEASVCAALDRIIRTACAFRPEDRFPDAGAMERALRELSELLRAAGPDADKILSEPFRPESPKQSAFPMGGGTYDADPAASSVLLTDSPSLTDTVLPGAANPSSDAEDVFFSASSGADFLWDDEEYWDDYTDSPAQDMPYSSAQAEREPAYGGGAVFCSRCGARLIPGGRFCTCCGSPTAPDYPAAAASGPSVPAGPAFPGAAMPSYQSAAGPGLAPRAAPPPALRQVQFSAVAPKTLIKGDYSIIHVMMYEESSRREVDRLLREAEEPAQETRSGVHTVGVDSVIRVTLSSPDVEIEDAEEQQIWRGAYLDFSFAVCLPEDFSKRKVLFTASVYVNDVIATRLKFAAKCSSLFQQKLSVIRSDVLSAFVSYASQDRSRVAVLVQGIKAARPDMDVFFDVESLRSGDNWQQVLYEEIRRRDVLYLCWSHYARQSEWVDREWRYALEQKGEEGIQPVAMETPDKCPPPGELSHLHFNDRLLFVIEAEKNRQSHREMSPESPF